MKNYKKKATRMKKISLIINLVAGIFCVTGFTTDSDILWYPLLYVVPALLLFLVAYVCKKFSLYYRIQDKKMKKNFVVNTTLKKVA